MMTVMKKREKRRKGVSSPPRRSPPPPLMACMVPGLVLLLSVFASPTTADMVSFSRSETDTTRFNHLTVDRNSGRVYVGSVNWLYQLLPNLDLEVAERSGPHEDSPECPVSGDCPATVTKMTDNVNKVLVIDYMEGRLITCGSLFQGLCDVRKLHNVSISDPIPNEPVAANNATATTVAFIAPGPPNPPTSHVLYVGVSFTANSPYRTDVPAVCSRSLDPYKMLSIASMSVTTGTRVLVNSLARERYPINYVFGFASRGFSYFLTTQKKSIDKPYPFISKLIRICHKDQDYYSYTEIPIECKSEGGDRVDYNLVQSAYLGKPGSELAVDLGVTSQEDVLYAVFAQSKNESDVYDKASVRSALCVYSMRAIHRKFTQNIQHCFSGNGHRGLDFINPSVPCVHTQLVISDDFCGTDVNTPLGGEIPVTGHPVITFQSPLLTAVGATSTHDYTVAFLGTNNGHLLKVVIETSKNAFQYSDLEVERNSPVNADLLFDPNREHVYVMTERKVTRLKVQECYVYKSCGECLGAKDPYCGWCSLENKCSLRSECAQASQDPLYWLPYRSGKCTTITNVQPFQIQRTTARTLQLTIDNLPTLPGQFVCVFTAFHKPLQTNATRTAQGVSCPTPRTDSLPPIPPGQHHFTAKLSVKNWNGPEFVATNFTFYDCNTYSSCTQCVSSPFPCDWCVDGHRCTHDTGENCRNDILVTGVNNIGPSIRSGPGFCPRINATGIGGSTEILVPYESVMRITVKVDNMALLEDLTAPEVPTFIMQTRFVCQFNIEGRVKQVSAQLLGDTIYCENMEFKYNSNTSNITATFAVIWGGSKPLDNPDNIHVLVYRCPYMADNCGLCLALPDKYQCGWCQSSDKCQVTEQCDGKEVAWLDRQKTCPNPRILDFYPKTGPLEGGTKVTILGINLGKTFEDIQSGVSVAGHQCIPIQAEYIRTSRIVCEIKTPDLPPSNLHKGPVIVKVQDSFRGESDTPFVYVSPVIWSIHPRKGPKSGGTRLNITGEHMNAGSTIEAFIDNLPCKINRTAETWAMCTTTPADRLHEGELRMKFDHGERTLKDIKFRYVSDPEIISVESGPAVQKGIARGIPSGGIIITVQGNHFDAIQDPKIYVSYGGRDYVSLCKVNTATLMHCLSPRITVDLSIDADNPKRLELGFIMDNVNQYRNYTLFLYPDPKYTPFDEKDQLKYYKSDYLTINGENLDRASKETDVSVQIGTSFCNVTSLSRTQLTCRPPTSQPPARDHYGNPDSSDIPQVMVIIGGNLTYRIGRLSYESPMQADRLGLPHSVIIGVTVGGGILLIIVICILIAYRRKSTESNRVLKNMQEQMDVLELRVAAECKEAFAELQTEMTDLTSDLTSGGIPFLDYRVYAMKILFPNIEDHPVLRELDIDSHRRQMLEKGLRLFGQLIMNKTFLLLFIRTLESNRYFSMRDRVNVASLIMVTLQGKMEYCTDILKTLLAELIEKCIEGKSHPKLLMRRTESVAEKMQSAWFTFLLYKFLKECAGEPLFMLYRAIKQQVDKGPVDAITSEARYSLSEEKLIRQSIEYKCMTVYVSISPQTSYVSGLDPHSEMDLPVKVLDCDTISQVKEKALDSIYKSTSFSQRPSKDDLDLEWRTGMTGRLILSDEDNTTKTEGEWKKLNTLAHFKVQEGAQLTLVPKQSSMYNLSILSEKSEKSHKYETLNFSKFSSASPPLSRATSPLNHDPETGYKYWHLVRHHDNDASKEGERGNKMVSEIYLTRLLATKGTLQKFVDDLFETIFSTAHRGSALPLAIKYMFDFLDDQALQHGISDPEVVHTWKSNSLPLRFWVNLIKNPNFVFDIYKSNIVDSCLSVVAQTFMDSCSTSDHRLGKDSPSSKLLYAKDIPVYKEWVERYYRDIKMMQAISDQDMNAMLAEESRMHTNEFNTNCALYELYNYAIKYNDQLIQTLEEDEFSKKNKLGYKLEHVHSVMAGESEA